MLEALFRHDNCSCSGCTNKTGKGHCIVCNMTMENPSGKRWKGIGKRVLGEVLRGRLMNTLFRKYATPDAGIMLITNFREWQQ